MVWVEVLLVYKGQFRSACILLIIVDWSFIDGSSPQRTGCEPRLGPVRPVILLVGQGKAMRLCFIQRGRLFNGATSIHIPNYEINSTTCDRVVRQRGSGAAAT